MADFGKNPHKLRDGAVVRYPLADLTIQELPDNIAGGVLQVLYAGEHKNAGLRAARRANALLRAKERQLSRDEDKAKREGKELEQFRHDQLARLQFEEACEQYGAHVIVGWEGVNDRHGVAVAFSPDEARQLLAFLGPELCDSLFLFCQVWHNFSDAAIDAEEVADVANP